VNVRSSRKSGTVIAQSYPEDMPVPVGTTVRISIAVPIPKPSPTRTPTPTPTPSAAGTPSMAPGAKECDKGVWAGSETSCALANAVAAQVDVKNKKTQRITAFSPSSNQEYPLECTYGRGFTCKGLEGNNVNVWLVA